MREDIRGISGRQDGIDNCLGMDQRFEATNQQIAGIRQDMNGRFEQVDKRFDTQEHILHQILERLPKQ